MTSWPRVLLNCAASADGRLAAAGGAQTPLSNLADRCRVQALRAGVGAVLVGSGTVLTDDPHLTVKPALAARWYELVEATEELAEWVPPPPPPWSELLTMAQARDRHAALAEGLAGQPASELDPEALEAARELWDLNPLRVVLDGRGRTPAEALVADGRARTLIFTSTLGGVQLWGRFADWPNVEVVVIDGQKREVGVSLEAVFKTLASRGVGAVLVEGGSRVLGSLLPTDLWETFTLFYRPSLLGDQGVPLASFGGEVPLSDQRQRRLQLVGSVLLPALQSGDWQGLLVRFVRH